MTKPHVMDESLRIVCEDLNSASARALISASNAELTARYPEEGATHFGLHPDEVGTGRGAFLIAYRGSEPIGCGAIRRISEHDAEIKRMFVRIDSRRHGVGQRLLAALEVEARRLGVQRLLLETGERQPEALALYVRNGFERSPSFGEYVDSPLSVCMSKQVRAET